MRSAIFDLDGTLADTSADLIAAANAGLGAELLHPARDQALAFRGGRAMLREGLARAGSHASDTEVERRLPAFLAHYEANIDRHTRLYPGVEGALDSLASAGWVLGVCTNKPAALAETLLGRLGLRDRFAALLGGDSLPVRKPDPRHLTDTIAALGGNPARAVLVGDSDTDRNAAKAAGVACVLVTFGPEGAAVEALGPEALLPDYALLPDLLDRLIR
ncbi:HAD-IA family hydrolase [Halovulum dunhuangense]|uniref:Phosphoglycolate phosphatase n=1 Tax=Halovulum dunhuangense TaxID=1505036 RepID=A0A849L432_9RHOB|nr:HAD-IA family hydrolase [Halovulum dunhuangense]NNU81095.1 HAD-IA family hydrolase [Halovulum dunhuangense]